MKLINTVKKFEVPEYVVELLCRLPIVTGFGIKGDVLAIEDSLLAGRSLKLSRLVELAGLSPTLCWLGTPHGKHALRAHHHDRKHPK